MFSRDDRNHKNVFVFSCTEGKTYYFYSCFTVISAGLTKLTTGTFFLLQLLVLESKLCLGPHPQVKVGRWLQIPFSHVFCHFFGEPGCLSNLEGVQTLRCLFYRLIPGSLERQYVKFDSIYPPKINKYKIDLSVRC